MLVRGKRWFRVRNNRVLWLVITYSGYRAAWSLSKVDDIDFKKILSVLGTPEIIKQTLSRNGWKKCVTVTYEQEI